MIDAVKARIEAAIHKHLGGEVRALVPLTGGATKATWSVDAVIDGAPVPLIIQHTPGERPAGGNERARVHGAREAALLRAARDLGVPAPCVRIVLAPDDGLGEGVVADRVDGETLGRKINTDPRFAGVRPRLAAQCGEILAGIHRIDAAGLPFLLAQTPREHLAMYRQLADAYDHPLPAVEYGLRWVADNLPAAARAAVVHGDFRNGNLIVGDDGVRCVLDWELAQIGDPMMDLGWLCVKTWRFGGAAPVGGFGARDELFAAYERAGGGPVDAGHVRFWEAFGCVKWALMCLHKGLGPSDERGRIEAVAIGRRIEEPLLDFLDLVTAKEP